MDWFEYGPFTVFDLETTGMSPVNDRIVEVVKKIQNGELKAEAANIKLFEDLK